MALTSNNEADKYKIFIKHRRRGVEKKLSNELDLTFPRGCKKTELV